jgi:hypothetical protein
MLIGKGGLVIACQVFGFSRHRLAIGPSMGHRSIANTVVYTAVADKRTRNIWGK